MFEKIEIKQAKNSDIPQIINIIDKHYQLFGDKINLDFYDIDLQNIELSYKIGKFWVCTLNKKVIAFIALLPLNRKNIEIKRFYVAPESQGSKIASVLMKLALKYSVKFNYKKISLMTDLRYKRALSFYTKKGFKITQTKQMFDADNAYIGVFMELELSKIQNVYKTKVLKVNKTKEDEKYYFQPKIF